MAATARKTAKKAKRYPPRPKPRSGKHVEGLNPRPSRWAFLRRKWFLRTVVMAVLLGIAGTAALVTYRQNHTIKNPKPLSRQVMELAEEQVRGAKPPPTTAALSFAYVASAYHDALEVGGQRGGLYAANKLLPVLYPDGAKDLPAKVAAVAKANNVKAYKDSDVPEKVKTAVEYYLTRYKNDGHDLAWDGVVPTGPGKWVSKTGVAPLTPRAGDWNRWNVREKIVVPPPPTLNSAEDQTQLLLVRQAVASRNGQDVNVINFWGGVPGTDSPGGIWQNQLYKQLAEVLPEKRLDADKKYAYIQKILAQTISDAFMECWRAKFTYWTARPDMRDTSIVTSMPDPNFPGYISGHSTISKAAADVLSVLVPAETNQWQAWAVEARNSRLVAGIHFDVDNKVGFEVGAEVARQTVLGQELQQEL